jgi:K+-sensing histidine kinase KdpD
MVGRMGHHESDLSALRTARRQARARPSLLATVAHELRGPLAAIETSADILGRDLDRFDEEQVRAMVSGIHRRTVWLRQLLENLLCSAAVREGRLQVHRTPLDVVESVREIDSIVAPLLMRKGQTLMIVAAPTTPLVDADAHRISQVLLNLLSNAHRYADAGSEIEIAVTTQRGAVRVSVSDRGPGVPPAFLRGAFRAYDRAGRTGGEGLGIGLWVVRSIVRAHRGRVGVFNRDGGGATFWFELSPMAGRPPSARPLATPIAEATVARSAV